MEEVSLDQLRADALAFYKAGEKWHFHLLTPSCVLNKSSQYAAVVECSSKNYVKVHYSDKAEKELAHELSPLLHGKDVLKNIPLPEDYKPSEIVKNMVQRAKELNSKGTEWHHHLLFPDCNFNSQKPLFILTIEDSKSGQVLSSATKDEPHSDLKQIEMLFFAK